MKFAKWLDNFWYHYKWVTIITVFLIAVALICTLQLVNKTEVDAYVKYVGNTNIPKTKMFDIKASLESLTEDSTGDGKKTVDFSWLSYITDPENPFYAETNASAKEQLSSMAVLPYYIYIMPAEVYDTYKGTSVFTPLSEIFGNAVPDFAYDDGALYYNQTYFARNMPGGEGFPEDTVIALKVVPYCSNKKTAAKEQASFDNHLKLFKNIVGN